LDSSECGLSLLILPGYLYFPKLKNDFEVQKNKIKLFSRQVFITDEVKDIVPEFLLLLHGVIDSPDIPLERKPFIFCKATAM
jgi:HSP90 family molecular chaperone